METTTNNIKQLRKVVSNLFDNYVLGVDGIGYSNKKNAFFGKRGFFYRHGCTSEMVANNLKKNLDERLAECGHKERVVIVEHHEEWKPWPKDSFWIVYFVLQ